MHFGFMYVLYIIIKDIHIAANKKYLGTYICTTFAKRCIVKKTTVQNLKFELGFNYTNFSILLLFRKRLLFYVSSEISQLKNYAHL